jgi:predicted methyltransferase
MARPQSSPEKTMTGVPQRISGGAVLGLTALVCLMAFVRPAVAAQSGFQEEVTRIERALALRPGATVADIGAGDGKYSVALAKIVGPSGHLYATEISEKSREEIREAVADAGLENVTVIEAGATTTGLPDGCCDAVLMRNVYHHLTDPVAIDAGVLRALKPGGLFAVVDFPPGLRLPGTPDGLPENRSGHGISPELVQSEVIAAGFEVVTVDDEWPSGWFADPFCVVFRKP